MKKTILITGASGDIGLAIAKKFALENYNIIYHYNKNLNEGVISALSKSANVLPVKADLTDEKQIQYLVNIAVKTFGKIDILINNAGISSPKLAIDESYSSISSVIGTNLISTIYLTSLIIPHLNENSSIINISSIWGVYGGSGESTYSASKSGLIGYTKALAKELGTSKIRVNAIAPGLIDTKMNLELTKQEKKEFLESHCSLATIGTPEDVANITYFLAGDGARYISGQVLGVDGGFI